MKLQFQKSNKPPKWKTALKVPWKAYLLTDDLIHRGITRTAEKIEEKTSLTRRQLTKGSLGLMYLEGITPFLLSNHSMFSKIALGMLFFWSVPYSWSKIIIDRMPNESIANNEKAESPVKLLLKKTRLSIFVPGIFFVANSWYNNIFEIKYSALNLVASAPTGFGLIAYLISSSNGMLDRVKNFFKKAKDKLSSKTEPDPVPEPNTISRTLTHP
jgi:hypothetical protein